MKTSELIGPTLDWAAAQANNTPLYASFECGLFIVEYREGCGRNADYSQYVKWTPSTDWSQGGPIIEREKIDTLFRADNVFLAGMYYHSEFGCYTHEECGPTPLIAAMRCLVASKLGDEIEIPEELK